MNRYALSHHAELDMLRILDYLDLRSERAAAEMERRFIDAFIYLSEWSGSGHFREDLTSPNLKTWNVDNYVIVYGPDEFPLRIYAIVHGSRDMHSVFTGRPPIA